MERFEQRGVVAIRETKGKLPRLPFVQLRDAILGKHYEVTIVFSSPRSIKNLNKVHRKKDYIPNVLSFPLEKKSGEIYACLSQIRRDAKQHDQTYEKFLLFLIIHSMLHLKGYAHGSKMEKAEASFLRRFT